VSVVAPMSLVIVHLAEAWGSIGRSVELKTVMAMKE
jgi:hypothetical protein